MGPAISTPRSCSAGSPGSSRSIPPAAPSCAPRSRRSGGQGELARAGAEAELEQRLFVRAADDGLAVDALQREPLDAAALDGVGQGGEGGLQARVVVVDED